ncbi:TetR/AcrR family transcriptional regulator [Streptomyces lasiicapitis]|uniref:TetR family transcriptional regulator n=1 Tax=Streptomyces lasiicapitis TaxID=1923961 RepID=A0ABQ2MLD4_9ACTN|nr:TetR/AcrR family transcriptional regulator [Streptomyces lasiicapitis]GGO54118.1 TetR family transcriptional regulator [Streptomyces lasiicapitis]
MTSQPVRRPRDRKQTIIRTAAELFSEKGFHGVHLGEIATAVGISTPALYRHFKGKSDLLARVLAEDCDRIQRIAGAADSAQGALRGLAEGVAERRELAVLWQREARNLPEELRDACQEQMRSVGERVAGLLRRERPELSAGGAELLAWASLRVAASPGHHRVPCTPARLQERMEQLSVLVLHHGTVHEDGPAHAPAKSAGGGLAPASRREALIGAATELFGSRGFHEVSLDDIGAAVGIAGPSVYKHFAGKGEILYELLNRGAAVLQLVLTRAMSTARTPQEALDALVRGYVEVVGEHTEMFSALVTEVINLPDDQRHAIRRIQHDYVAEWVELLRQVRPDLDRTDARLTVQGVLGMISDVWGIPHLRRRPRLAEELAGLSRLLFSC